MEKMKKQQELKSIANELIEQLEIVNTDLNISKRSEFKEKIIQDINELEKSVKTDKIYSIICQQISDEYIARPKDFPKPIVDLYYQIRMEKDKYDSLDWGAVQAGLTWFEK